MPMSNSALPRVGVGAIVTRGSEILLIRRAGRLGRGTWSSPGGLLEFGEDPDKCAVRECAEETGLIVSPFHFLALTNEVLEGIHFLTVWMHCIAPLTATASIASDEAFEIAWVQIDQIPQPTFTPFAHLLKGISAPPDAWRQVTRLTTRE